ncbi:MAG: methyltransferase domain-containing protein [Microcella sp.]|uniref:class I SAM-dependent methyltransferase n=1 Tax=Microcella sp. TaxID=1913979 RepID=UPI002715A543|nr:methyltransferase domain-containing protein [Microcella sp.]MDO8336743.1 methyltransferase domain-containing protein [Microcella sp.]
MARERYSSGARLYDALSAEWPVYRVGRTTAIERLDPRPGERVLDLGCGTGLNHSLLDAAVGPDGAVLGVDRSAAMLEVARRRAERRGLRTVRLLESDATALDVDAARSALGGPADVVIATYTLSIMSDPVEAWRRALAVARPGARVAIVDMKEPHGSARLVAPLARAFAGFGGADLDVQPWRMIETGARGVSARGLRGGHIQVRVGTLPEAPSAAADAATSEEPAA